MKRYKIFKIFQFKKIMKTKFRYKNKKKLIKMNIKLKIKMKFLYKKFKNQKMI